MTGSGLSFEDFCQRLLSLFEEGRFTATYKYAVLIGLLDVLYERVGPEGEKPTVSILATSPDPCLISTGRTPVRSTRQEG